MIDSTSGPDQTSESDLFSSWSVPILAVLYLFILTSTKWPLGTDLIEAVFAVGPAKQITPVDLYLVVLGLFTAALMLHEKYDLTHALNGYTVFLFGYIAALLLSSVSNGVFNIDAIKEILQWIEMGVLMWAIIYWLRNQNQFERLKIFILIIATIHALYLTGSWIYFGLPKTENARFFVQFTGFSFLIGMDLIWRKRRWRWFSSLLIFLFAIYIGDERKVYLALTLGVFIYFFIQLYRYQPRIQPFLRWTAIGILMISFLIPAAFLAFPYYCESQFDQFIHHYTGKGNANSRYYLMKTGFKIWNDHLFFGIGPNQFKNLSVEYGLGDQKSYLTADSGMHNMLFSYVLNTGLIGFIFLIGLLVQPLRFVKRSCTNWLHEEVLLAVLLCFVCSVLLFNSHEPFQRYLLFSTLGLAAAVQWNFPGTTRE